MSELAVLVALGAFHGINPGMGWLFAVALGLQERRAAAVWQALPPLAAGHALAVVAVLSIAVTAELILPPELVRLAVGVLLVSLGLRRLTRHGHVGFGGMRVGSVGLTAWSFLMATAHGAGLMLLPVVLGPAAGTAAESVRASHAAHTAHVAATSDPIMSALIPTLVHSAAYLGVTALVALVVYARFGVGLLRNAWINLDLIWAAALVVTGGIALVM